MEDWRNTPAYKRWQTLVLKRDKFRCVKCDTQENLICDHIKSGDLYPSLRYVIANGRTLCRNCHGKYGMRYYRPSSTVNDKEENGTIKGVRRLFRIGGSLMITLPSQWTKKWNIKKGDELGCFTNLQYVKYIPIE